MEESSVFSEAYEIAASYIPDQQRTELQARLTANFESLLFHREGYHTIQFSHDVMECIARRVELQAFMLTCQAFEDGMEAANVVGHYAKEAATLLLAEVEKFSVPVHSTGSSRSTGSSAGNGLDAGSMSLNEFSGVLRSIQTVPAQQQHSPKHHKDALWGWLVPGSRMLPYVVLKGNGVAIGRGKEALWAVGAGASTSTGTPRSHANGHDKELGEVLRRNLGFVEVPDGRISRLHCIITQHWLPGQDTPAVQLEDCSSNGTFVNGKKLKKGEAAVLNEDDRISLVLSVAPLTEQYYTFRQGDPRDLDVGGEGWLDSAHSAGIYTPIGTKSPIAGDASSSGIFRTATSRYTTAEQSTLDDLRCQICLNTLRNCVALVPCGHNFCATCLSHHLGNQLQSGLQLTCPFRCPPPERIIINYAVRGLIDLLTGGRPSLLDRPGSSNLGGRGISGAGAFAEGAASSSSLHSATLARVVSGLAGAPSGSSAGGGGAAAAAGAAAGSSSAEGGSSSSANGSPSNAGNGPPVVRPASSGGQRSGSLEFPGGQNGGPPAIGSASLASLASSAPPPALGSMARTESLEGDFYTQSMSLLCPLEDRCLPMDASNLKAKQVDVSLGLVKDSSQSADTHQMCLEALARLSWSDDEVRESISNAGGIRAIVDVMALHASHDGVQCNSCLALMALVRGEGEVCQSNQWNIAKAGAVEAIAAAMVNFRDNAMVQLSVLLCFIPLALENAMMQAHITQLALQDVMLALDNHIDEVDVQTKGLVLLGVLIQGDDATHDAIRQRELEEHVPARVARALERFGPDSDDLLWAALFVLSVLVRENSSMYAAAAHKIAKTGVLGVLRRSVDAYKVRYEEQQLEPDEMVVSAGDYLVRVLEPLAARAQQQWLALGLAGAGVAITGAALLYLCWRGCGSKDRRAEEGHGASNSKGAGRAVMHNIATQLMTHGPKQDALAILADNRY